MKRLIFALIAIALPSAASAVTLVDGSFETPNLGTGNYSYATQPVGWTGTGALVNAQGASAWYGTTPPSGQDGAQFYAVQTTSSIYQNFIADRSGELMVSWLSAGRPDFGGYGGDQSYDVSLTGSGIELGSLGTFTTHSGQAFERLSGLATVTAGEIYTISFHGLSTSDQTAFIDDVSVSSVGGVPEAAAWIMMVAGFALMGIAKRIQREALVS